MSRLQPNFPWQKYDDENSSQDEDEQFQYQQQRQFTTIANAINTTIDQLSYSTNEVPTPFTWIDGSQIFKKSLLIAALPAGPTTIATGITDAKFTVVYMQACVSNGDLSSSITLNLPHLDVAVAANEISIVRNGTDIVITTGGTNYSAYSGYVQIFYIKGR